MASEDLVQPVAVGAALVAVSVLAWLYKLRKNKQTDPSSSWKDQLEASRQNNNTAREALKPATGNVWEERRRAGIVNHSFNKREDVHSNKPFASSYYYAHNNAKRTGGYTDGLGMEDFTMNGPRLLSRNGKPVDDMPSSTVQQSPLGCGSSSEQETSTHSQTTKGNESTTTKATTTKRCIAISRYLWDDPGNSKGVASIRIDELPDPKQASSALIPFESVSISNIDAQLLDGGLQVVLDTPGDVQYRLRIPKLYGKASQVTTLQKQKRLLIKLHKTTGVLNRSNAKAWPHPQKKSA